MTASLVVYTLRAFVPPQNFVPSPMHLDAQLMSPIWAPISADTEQEQMRPPDNAAYANPLYLQLTRQVSVVMYPSFWVYGVDETRVPGAKQPW